MPNLQNARDAIASLQQVRHVVLDMDGTIYLGSRLFEATLPLLDLLSELGIGYSFITNNNSRGRDEYVEFLHGLGIDVGAEVVVTSAQATVEYLHLHNLSTANVFVFGSPGLQQDLRRGGCEIVERDPELVIVGYDPHFTHHSIAQTAYWISQGVPYVATHPDRVCPTDEPILLPDCGAICALLEAATGRPPEAYCGKPDPTMLAAVCRQHQVIPQQVAMVGDRMYTDMEMARRAGCLGILTLTGETTAAEAAEAGDLVDLVVADLAELCQLFRAARTS